MEVKVKKTIETTEQTRKRLDAAMSTNLDFDGVDLRVYLHLCSVLDYENYIHVPQITLAIALRRTKPQISRAIKRLTDEGVIIPGPKGVRSSEWRLNPDYRGK